MQKLMLILLTSFFLLTSLSSRAEITYIHTDGLGSIVAKSDASGNIVQRSHYTPFGQTLETGDNNKPGYTGHVYDDDLSLSYMKARYYDPVIGRFYSNDPIGFRDVHSFNRYTYANNNPINNTDPTGKATCANSDCSTSYIDHTVNLGASSIDSSISGDPAARTASITFVNDTPGGASTDLPVTTSTALMVESAVRNSGADSVNINSSTGGHQPPSRHASKKAVDINRINGKRVDDPSNASNATNLQDAFSQTGNIRENFGPSSQTKTSTSGAIVDKPNMAPTHKDHVHASGQN